MSRAVEIMVAVHVDRPEKRAVMVSPDGENKRGKWIARSHIVSMHETGQTTIGTDMHERKCRLPIANIEIPEWLAKREGFI